MTLEIIFTGELLALRTHRVMFCFPLLTFIAVSKRRSLVNSKSGLRAVCIRAGHGPGGQRENSRSLGPAVDANCKLIAWDWDTHTYPLTGLPIRQDSRCQSSACAVCLVRRTLLCSS